MGDNKRVYIRQFGNIANNAFYNSRILNRYTKFRTDRIHSLVIHAMSTPAWESLDFDVPDLAFVDQPNWNQIPGAQKLNNQFLVSPRTMPSTLWTLLRRCTLATKQLAVLPVVSFLRIYAHILQLIVRTIRLPTQLLNKLSNRLDAVHGALQPERVAENLRRRVVQLRLSPHFKRFLRGKPKLSHVAAQGLRFMTIMFATLFWLVLFPLEIVRVSALLAQQTKPETLFSYSSYRTSFPLQELAKKLAERARCSLIAYNKCRSRVSRRFHRESTGIDLIFGYPGSTFVSRSRVLVTAEHGTLRWMINGPGESHSARAHYRDLVSASHHLWVTNVDQITLSAAEQVASGRWSLLPHPYTNNSEGPVPRDHLLRHALGSKTNSQLLVCAPASINWLPDHDKGTLTILTTFVALRKAGVPIGLVLIEWGRQVREAQALLRDAGVYPHVVWMKPLPRRRLQRLLASVDVALDQFGLPAFGALALRCMEQGVPLISHPLEKETREILGTREPWLKASDAELLEGELMRLWTLREKGQFSDFSRAQGQHQREWLRKRHHPAITALLELRRYATLLELADFGPAKPGEWGALPDYGTPSWLEIVHETLSVPRLNQLTIRNAWKIKENSEGSSELHPHPSD